MEVRMISKNIIKGLFLFIVINLLSIGNVFAQLSIYCAYDPPLQIQDKDSSLREFHIEIVKEIQKRVNNKDKIQIVPRAKAMKELDSKKDVVFFSMPLTEERHGSHHWIGPTKECIHNFYAKVGSGIVIKDIEDAKCLKSIGVCCDDLRDKYLTSLEFQNLERFTDNKENLQNLMSGQIDILACSNDTIVDLLSDTGFTRSSVKPIYTFMHEQLYIVISKKTSLKTVKKWKDAFEEMKKDGTFRNLHRKYFPNVTLPGAAVLDFKE